MKHRPFRKESLELTFMMSALCLLIFAGCRTAPDMKPFADATAQLSGSIKTAGRTTVSEVDNMSAKWDSERRKKDEVIVQNFKQEWQKRERLADALVTYSASLAAIAEAGEQGEKSAKAVANSVKNLTDAVGVAFPQAKVGEVVVNLGSYLYGKYAQDHAAKTLGESMTRLQPVIDETASILSSSFDSIENGLDAVRDQNKENVEDEIIEGDKIKVTTLRNRLKHLQDRRATLVEALDAGANSRDSLRVDLVRAADATKQAELDRLSKLMTDIASELAVLDNAIKADSDTLKPIDARQAADYARLTAAMDLVSAAKGGLMDWAAAHSRLATAALEQKTPQVQDLIQTASEIRDLIQTVRAGQKN